MNVLVVGAGTVGTMYGWALAESGHHVVHLVRSGEAAALGNGLLISLFDKRKGRHIPTFISYSIRINLHCFKRFKK